MRFNVIGTFFNQTLPSSIGGDAVRLWLVARTGAGWRAATYSIFVDRAIGLIALAVIIVASLPWSYRLITDPHGRSALLFVDFAALAGGLGFLVLGRLPWPWLKRWWGTHHIHACSVIANRVLFSRAHGPKVAVLSLLVHVLAVVIAWCVVQSIAAPVLFGQIFQLVPPVMLITMLPISIAGWGVREATHGAGVRLRRPDGNERGCQRLSAVRRGFLHRRRIRRAGLDFQRRKGSTWRGADRGS